MADQEKIQNTTANDDNKLSTSIYLLFLILIVDLLGFTIILPLMPSIFDYYDGNKDNLYIWMESKVRYFQLSFGSPEMFNKVLFAGLLGSIFSALQFLVAPIFGSLSDVYGRKPILILSLIGIGLSHSIWYFANCFYLFIIARIVGGLSRANISLATAIVTDLCSEKNRGRGMAFIGIAFAIGFIIGPMIGAFFASQASKYYQEFFAVPALFALLMTLLDIVLVTFFFTESLPHEKRSSSVGQGLSKAYQFINPMSLFFFTPVIHIDSKEKNALKKLGFIYFLFLFIYSGLEYSLSFLTHTRFNFTSMQQGKMYLFSGIIMILIQGCYTRKIKPGQELKNAAFGVLMIIPAFILIGLSTTLEVLYLGIALYAYASATVVPCLTTIASRFGSSSQKGTVLGIFRSLGSLARAFGPMVSAVAYWSVTPNVSYTIGGFLLIIPLSFMLKSFKELSTVGEKMD